MRNEKHATAKSLTEVLVQFEGDVDRVHNRWLLLACLVIVAAFAVGNAADAAPGLTKIVSAFGATETISRLEAAVTAAGMTLFARIDHAEGAATVGASLRPTVLLIFGNAKAGTPLMVADQTVGIDLPLKALVYEDAAGKVWVAYDEPQWIAARHRLGPTLASNVAAMSAAMHSVLSKATRSARPIG